ncbi:hypothetical protein BpHYR1_002475 [Brachionus plicatilis]|uniref:Uncharacterized protein n=1 Tax=Brachionus plicatilis TaxID=10195 RepID=A0A3M7SAY3_BRAPC|nr:hypothetical protein BpHYR1_002475 [Brachionus plicatilis]
MNKDYYKLHYSTINNRSLNDVSTKDTSKTNNLNKMFYNMDHNEKTPKSILFSDDDAQKTPESYCYGKDIIKEWNPTNH